MIIRSRIEDKGDGSSKIVLETVDGALVEAVRFVAWDDVPNICVSSQIGCSFACRHCATGTMQLKRNLAASEMIDQVKAASWPGDCVDVLFMGMGEPFANLGEVMRAIERMVASGQLRAWEQAFVCTSGIASRGWEDLARLPNRPHLTVSLHAGTDATRVRVVPHAERMDLAALAATIRRYTAATGDTVDLNYTVLGGVNDDDANFAAFAAYAHDHGCRARIIPFNTWLGAPFGPASTERTERLCAMLANAGVPVLYRPSAGSRIGAGCGQLAVRGGELEHHSAG